MPNFLMVVAEFLPPLTQSGLLDGGLGCADLRCKPVTEVRDIAVSKWIVRTSDCFAVGVQVSDQGPGAWLAPLMVMSPVF